MNPGNGIETDSTFLETSDILDFHINESRQRDWNEFFIPMAQSPLMFSFTLMNPGNGIETMQRKRTWGDPIPFTLMNPGNGIETTNAPNWGTRSWSFTLMNPGNGIETLLGNARSWYEGNFHINESRQRDWNAIPRLRIFTSRGWAFTLMNPGNGIETDCYPNCWGRNSQLSH